MPTVSSRGWQRQQRPCGRSRRSATGVQLLLGLTVWIGITWQSGRPAFVFAPGDWLRSATCSGYTKLGGGVHCLRLPAAGVTLTQRAGSCGRRVVAEATAVAGVLAYAFLSQPRGAPGPSDLLLAQERRAILDVQKAKREVGDALPEEAEEVEARLRKAEARLERVADDIKQAHKDLDNYPLPAFLEDSYSQNRALIAVTGASGVGKSSWINAVRRMKPRSPGAAKTGVTETTTKPEMFTFCPGRTGVFLKAFAGVGRLLRWQRPDEEPIQPGDRLQLRGISQELDGALAQVISRVDRNKLEVQLDDGTVHTVSLDQVTGLLAECALWDLPGVGTPRFPQATYLREMGIRHFDLVVLITASRFTEAELMLVEELRKWSVPFFLVRSKIDADVQSQIEEQEEEEIELSESDSRDIEQSTIQRIRDHFLSEYGLEDLYFISTRPKFRENYDFLRLEQDMEAAIKSQRIASHKEVQQTGSFWAKIKLW